MPGHLLPFFKGFNSVRTFLICFLLGVGSVSAQSHLNFATSDPDLLICGSAGNFSVTLNNFTSDTLRNVSITMDLHNGTIYIPGSLSGPGMSETNVSDPDSVILAGPDILPFQNLTYTFDLGAGCSAFDSSSVRNFILVTHDQGADSSFSGNYDIFSPSISVAAVSPSSFTGTVGTSFTRCVSFTNGGFGPLSLMGVAIEADTNSLKYSNFRDAATGTAIPFSYLGDSILFNLGATHFANVGDMDNLLELNEVVEVCYDVLIDDCINLSSSIYTSWGCLGELCQTAQATANVIVPATVPNLSISRLYSQSTCYGDVVPSVLKFVVTNTGSGRARDVEFDVWHGGPNGSANYISRWDTSTIRWAASGGGPVENLTPFYVEMGSTSGNFACLGTNPVRRFRVRIPWMDPGEQDTLIIDQYSCCKTWCSNNPVTANRSFYEVNYNDPCLTAAYSIPATQITSWNFGRILTLAPNGPTDVIAGDTAQYCLEHGYWRFYNGPNTGIFYTDLILPPTLVHSGLSSDLYFEDVQGDLWNLDSIQIIGDTVRAWWPYPRPAGFSLEKANLKFRVTTDCSGGPCTSGTYPIEYQAFHVPDPVCSCTTTIGCFSYNVNVHCGICPATCTDGGMQFLNFEAQRENYGLPDNDNNGVPDGAGTIDMNRVRTNYLMFKDTLFTRFTGFVDTTAANPFWVSGTAATTISPRGANMLAISHEVRIVDASTGAVYTCPLAAPTVTSGGGQVRRFAYDLDTAAISACLPAGFRYEFGDSVEVVARYVVNTNTSGLTETQSLTNEFFLENTATSLQASCDDFSGSFVMVGYYFTTSASTQYAAAGCGTTNVSENYYLSIGNCCSNYAGGNLFHYEYRYWAHLGQARVVLPPGYSFVSATLNQRHTTGTQSTAATSSAITPVSVSNDTVYFDAGSLWQVNGGTFPMGDDGWYGTLVVTLRPSCQVTPDVTRAVRYLWDFVPITPLTGAGAYPPQRIGRDSIRYEAPELVLSPTLQTVTGLNSTVSWDVTIENNSNSSDASNTWMAVVSPSGQITPSQFTDLSNSTVITASGGLYQIGLLETDSSRTYRITANYNTCGRDTLIVLAGWDCNTYPANLGSLTCLPVRDTLFLEPAQAEVQASISMPAGPYDICDSIPVELRIVSSQNASIEDVLVGLRLPLSGGLSYVSGTSLFEYPDSNGYSAIGDPVASGSFLNWDVNTLDPDIASRGLPGTVKTDSNTFRIRFYLQTNCSFISGESFIIRVQGDQACGDPLSPVVLISDPININGASQPYTTSVSSSSIGAGTCPLRRTIRISTINAGLGTTSNTDSIYVDLPFGYLYGGAFNSIYNSPAVTAPNSVVSPSGTRLSWQLPSGTSVGDSIVFSFEVEVTDQVGCGTNLINIQTAVTSNLFCSQTSTFCSAGSATGSDILSIPITRSDLNFAGMVSQLIPTTGGWNYNYSGTIQNSGDNLPANDTTTVFFYCDSDASGGYSSGDALLGRYDTLVAIPNGGSVGFNGGFFINSPSCTDSSMIYGLILPNSATGYCICDTVFGNSNVVLPVIWLGIEGEALPAGNEISWEALILAGHDYFVVEKETENSFVPISGEVRGIRPKYQWLDPEADMRERYRIRQVDQNGDVSYSALVEVRRENLRVPRIWPNPARDVLHVEGPAGTRVRLVNLLGQPVGVDIELAELPVKMPVDQLSAGVYFAEFLLEGKKEVLKVVVE